MHLIYNLSSFLWKGAQLETKMGSESYTKLLIGLLVSVQCAAVGAMWVLARFIGVTEPYYRSCTMVGNRTATRNWSTR
jgi:rhomboid domain-containing protein 1